jgi:hypothetical protein
LDWEIRNMFCMGFFIRNIRCHQSYNFCNKLNDFLSEIVESRLNDSLNYWSWKIGGFGISLFLDFVGQDGKI